MHGATMRIVSAQQAKLNNNYKNTRLKLLKTNPAIWFNKICKVKQLKPNYINIKINGPKNTRRLQLMPSGSESTKKSNSYIARSAFVG